jgi:hypothetical protein
MKVAIRIRRAVVQHKQWARGVIPLVECYLFARVEGKIKDMPAIDIDPLLAVFDTAFRSSTDPP